MKVKDLLAICDKDKLLACITEHYRDANGRTAGIEEVTALYLPVLEELSSITPISDGQHFVLASQRENGVKVMDFYRPGLEKWFQNMSAFRDMTEEDLIKSREVLEWAAQLTNLECYTFVYTPWAEVLDVEVFEDNIREVGTEEMSAQILLEMTEGGLTAEAIDAKRHELEELLSRTEYSSLNELLFKTLPQSLTKEQLLEWKIERANFNYRVYHLLKKYSGLWRFPPADNSKEIC